MLRIDVLTIFPGLFEAFVQESFVGIARERGRADVRIHDLREWATDRHRTVDDEPYDGPRAGEGREGSEGVALRRRGHAA